MKLLKKLNTINQLKTNYNTKITELENKISNTSNLVKKTDYNTKITDLENKIPDISDLATKTALTTVENKIPSISNLVKKTDYNTKVTEIEKKITDHNHNKYIDTSKFNTLATNLFHTRIAQANVITKTDFDAKLSNLNRTISQNKSKKMVYKIIQYLNQCADILRLIVLIMFYHGHLKDCLMKVLNLLLHLIIFLLLH